MEKSEFYDVFRTVPKAELHIHIEAVMSRNTIRALYHKKNGTELSDAEMEVLFSYSDLDGFIQSFLKVQDLFTSVDDFDLVFADLQQYLVRNGIVHCEAFFAPSAFLKKGFSYRAMTENFEKNIRNIREETGISVLLLGDVSRTFGVENAEKNLELFLANPFEGFVGIGLGGAESKGPSRDFAPVFENARVHGLHTVAHAGEDVGFESVRDAVALCHAERIGHGITAVQSDELMELLYERQIPLEMCPTSNVFTKKYVRKMEEHPVRAFCERGILVTLGTDDPVFFGVELLDEYWNLFDKLHFTADELKKIVLNGFEASFVSDSEKLRFKESVEAAWSRAQKLFPAEN